MTFVEVGLEPEAPTFKVGSQGNIVLLWHCAKCGWECEVEAPGFAGDGYFHYPNSNPWKPCGPLVAIRA